MKRRVRGSEWKTKRAQQCGREERFVAANEYLESLFTGAYSLLKQMRMKKYFFYM